MDHHTPIPSPPPIPTDPNPEKDGTKFTIVLSDTDNDLKSVKYSLWIVGVCKKNGKWRPEISNLRLIHTGDWLNKRNPEPEVVDYFMTLRQSAPDSCEVIILMGNHEVEILQKSGKGEPTGLLPNQLDFIRHREVMHVSEKTLYLHGYPTFRLLCLLKQFKDEKSPLNSFNKRFQKAFHEGRFALFKQRAGLAMVGDIKQAKKYYIHRCPDGETKGRKIGKLLKELNIKTVIHGHRPNVLLQRDYEFRIEIPGIRIINNDNRAKLTGLGAAIVDPKGRVMFINMREMYWSGGEKAFRKKIRRILGIH